MTRLNAPDPGGSALLDSMEMVPAVHRVWSRRKRPPPVRRNGGRAMLSCPLMKKALLLSILVHAAVLAGARPIAAGLSAAVRSDPAAPEIDRWSGTSIEVSTGEDTLPGAPALAATAPPGAGATTQNTITNAGSPGAADPVPANAPAVAATTAATATASAPPSAQPSSRPPRKARPRRPKRHRPTAPPASATSVASSAAPAAPPASASASAAGDSGAAPAASSTAVAGAGAGATGTFGSEGAASVRDLGRAFTRAIPAACSADPAWSKLAAGDAGSLRAAIRVDSEGHIQSADPLDKDPPKHLVNVLRRTVPLLQAGTFAVKGNKPTAGTQTLELRATVADEPPGDDDGSGARDRLAFSYDGGRGKASFTQTGGRRVDIQVRVVSVETGD